MRLKNGVYLDDAKDFVVLFDDWSDYFEKSLMDAWDKSHRGTYDIWLQEPEYTLPSEFFE